MTCVSFGGRAALLCGTFMTFAMAAPALAQSTVTGPPLITSPKADAVILKREEPADVVRTLAVRRRMPLAMAKASRTIELDSARLDLSPVLDNPKAPFNVAARLRAMPREAVVSLDDTTVYEIDKGVVIHTRLTYALRTGACGGARKAAVESAGAPCATRIEEQAIAAAAANPEDPHFVADPAQRAKAVADGQAGRAATQARIAGYFARFRASLATPVDRARFDAANGPGEAARLVALDDDRLALELINAGETSVEQVFFIPREERPELPGFASRLGAKNEIAPAQLPPVAEPPPGRTPGMTRPPIDAIPGRPANSSNAIIHQAENQVFLTGFTLGRQHEWRQRVEKTIKWCWVGCAETYHVEAYAGYSFGFGLRFPMRLSGQYAYREINGAPTASFTANYAPIDGSPADYLSTGLPQAKLFEGKELVAEVRAWAGAGYRLPVIGSNSVHVEVGKDFTGGLPAPFTNGQFRPPTPGEAGLPLLEKVFWDFDLLAGRANFGVVGGKVFPMVKTELRSDSIRFKLRDHVRNQTISITRTGQVVPLGVETASKASRFTISDPVYNLGFVITPGVHARVFLDIAVWENTWNWPVWFPQLSFTLPPGGVDFACHAGTRCARGFYMSPTRTSNPRFDTPPVIDAVIQ